MAGNSATFSGFATDAVHVGQEPEQWSSRAVIPPISLSTTFKQEEPGTPFAGYEYGRNGNPSRTCLEKCLASLEGADKGFVFSSGMAAITAMVHTLQTGDHIVSVDDVYGGTRRYFTEVASKFGIEASFVDLTEPENLRTAMKPNTKLVWIESPSSSLLKLTDIKALSVIAHEQPGVVVVVDNTIASSYFQRPIELGADAVLHSVSKYMNGHCDAISGAVMTSDEKLAEKLVFLQNAIGVVSSPFDCYLVNRGVKTLHLRMKEHMKNALMVAKALEADPRVEKVVYPGLESHPQHELAMRQMKGFSGMITFYVKGGLKEATTFMKSVKIFCLAEGLGGCESLCEHPATMSCSMYNEDTRSKMGIADNLVKLSVGIENGDQLVADVEEALTIAVPL